MKMKFYQKGATLGFISAVFLFISLLGIKTPISLAKEVKPGVVITDENYKEFPELKKLLPDFYYQRLENKDDLDHITKIEVEKPVLMKRTKGEYEWNKKNAQLVKEGKLYLDKEKDILVGWEAGIPFPGTKDLQEMTWNFYLRRWDQDSFFFNTEYNMLDKKLQYKMPTALGPLWYKRFMGRCDLDPKPLDKGDQGVYYKMAVVANRPYDVAGYAILRVRHWEPEKLDDSWLYMPAIRRVRRMMSADYQDPQFGTDNTLDDYATFFQKFSGHRLEGVRLEEANYLLPNHVSGFFDGIKNYAPIKESGKREILWKWAIRPCYKLVVKVNEPDYMYSKRVYYLDKHSYVHQLSLFYDQKGQLWRAHLTQMWIDPVNGGNAWICSDIWDLLTGSNTLISVNQDKINSSYADVNKKYDMKYLRLSSR